MSLLFRPRCPRSTTVSCRSSRWPATPAPGGQDRRHLQGSFIVRSACVGMRGQRAGRGGELQGERSTSSSGIRTRPPSSSTRWLRPRSPRWCWTSSNRIEGRARGSSLAIGRRDERQARLPAHRLGYRHLTEQESGCERVRRAHPALHGSARRRRGDRPAARHRGLRDGAGWPIRSGESPIEGFDEDTARRSRRGPAILKGGGRARRQAQELGSRRSRKVPA